MACSHLAACAFLALPAMAQLASVPNTKAPVTPFNYLGQPRFELMQDGPAGQARLSAESAVLRQPRGATVGHRYFYDEAAHTYFGYDVVIQPDHDDFYKVSFYDLSIGPLDFQSAPADALIPTLWNKLQIPTLPPSKVLQAGDSTTLGVYADAATGRLYTDTMTIASLADVASQLPNLPATSPAFSSMGRPMPQMIRRTLTYGAPVGIATPNHGFAFRPGSIPTVSGTAHDFSAADAEVHLQAIRVTVNGAAAEQPVRGAAAGSLVWIYLPGHGRYVLSLAPRPDLGFVKAGEFRGGEATFTVGADKVVIQSTIPIAPGDAPYVLYVMHDAEWAPTSQSQTENMLIGSVSPRELALLK